MRHLLALVTATLLCGPAYAAAPPLDRSALSFDENLIINTICGAARSQGASAYQACVGQQLAALQAHPSPDRSGLSAAQNKAVESTCDYVRRVSIGDYNECLRKTLSASRQTAEKSDDALEPNLAQVFAAGSADKPKAIDVAATAVLPRPQELLAKRPNPAQRAALSPAELYKAVERSVFVVLAAPTLADVRARNVAQGSAVAVSEHLLLTNCHVVDGRPLIKLMQDQSVDDAVLVAADPKADRCVIKASTLKLVPVAGVSPFDSLAVGERAFAIGAPRSLERTLSEGLVSGLRHQPGRNLVQTSAAVSPGSSGGGLFDERGNLIGITTLGSMAGAQNLNFAIAAADYWN
jgi:S1-C subfamily serine protease